MKLSDPIKQFVELSTPDHRYCSFDYCYLYFRRCPDLTKDMEKSCLSLGHFLASWGMYRGSGFLLQKSVKFFQPIIEYISELPKNTWDIDVDSYTEENVEQILKIYSEVKSLMIPNGQSDLVLITKTLLGVFGFIPAFDQYFCKTFRELYRERGNCGFRKFNKKSLGCISDFYEENKIEIDKFHNQITAIDFTSGKHTNVKYPKAKIIDMYGFQAGFKKP